VNFEDYHWPQDQPPCPSRIRRTRDFIRTELIEPAGLTVTAAAEALQVSRPTLGLFVGQGLNTFPIVGLDPQSSTPDGVHPLTVLRQEQRFSTLVLHFMQNRASAGLSHFAHSIAVYPASSSSSALASFRSAVSKPSVNQL
jgi:hypothetical protein